MPLVEMQAQDLMAMQAAGQGVVTLVGDSGHSVTIRAHGLTGEAPVWVATCSHCGSLAAHRQLVRAVRHAQDH